MPQKKRDPKFCNQVCITLCVWVWVCVRALWIFSALFALSLCLCFILQLPGGKRLRAPANLSYIPEMTCKSPNKKIALRATDAYSNPELGILGFCSLSLLL